MMAEKKNKTKTYPSVNIATHYMELGRKQEDRRRHGSSYNTSRMKNEAIQIATEARVLKKARRNQEAFNAYTAAIQIDPFNHTLYHHRAETNLNRGAHELGMWDAQAGLELCSNSVSFRHDECFSLMWCTLTRCCIEMRRFEKADEYCEIGLSVIGEDMTFALNVLKDYEDYIDELLDQLPTDFAMAQIKPVQNSGDDLSFFYSTKLASLESPPYDVAPNQPELLLVDVDDSMPAKEALECVFPRKVKKWTRKELTSDSIGKGLYFNAAMLVLVLVGVTYVVDDPTSWMSMLLIGLFVALVCKMIANRKRTQNANQPRVENFGIYSVPDTKYWVTAISVSNSLDRSVIQTRLMCDCMPNTKIVVLKLDKSEGPPTFDISEAEAYVAAIVRNAHNCETMYGMGQKLAE